MLRKTCFALGLLAAFSAPGESRAQWYGGYGWGGWGGGGGGTFQGSVARGLGYYYEGLGQYAVEDAQARSINEDTVSRWNQYWWESQREANKAERLRIARRAKRDAQSGEYLLEQVRNNPSPEDISSGNALDVILHDLADPRLHSSSLRLASDKIPAKLVKAIPFVNSSEAATICIDQLTIENGWPAALKDSKFAAERKAYSEAIDKALEEDQEGDISPETLQVARDALSTLRKKFEANKPADRSEYNEAETYLKTLIGMTRMLAKPEIGNAVAELDKIETTTLGNLIGFMQAYNLQFGRSTNAEQRSAYTALYPIMAAHRDRVMESLKGAAPATRAEGPRRPPTDFLGGTRSNAFDKDQTPAPPK